MNKNRRSATVWAVDQKVWDKVNSVLAISPVILPLIVDQDGNELGRPLFTQDWCSLNRVARYGSVQTGATHLHSQAYRAQHEYNPRYLIFSQWLAIERYTSWLSGPAVEIEYPFALTDEDMLAPGLTLQVELLPRTEAGVEAGSLGGSPGGGGGGLGPGGR